MYNELSQEELSRVQNIVQTPSFSKAKQLALQLESADTASALRAVEYWFRSLPSEQKKNVSSILAHRQ